MATIEEMIKESICFGIAYDSTVKECKICEVRTKCKAKCECGTGDLPEKPDSVVLADKEEVSLSDEVLDKTKRKETSGTGKKPVKEKKKSDIQYSEDMPDFKQMDMTEIENLLVTRGGNLTDFEKYKNVNIRKMRLVMALKKTYEIN